MRYNNIHNLLIICPLFHGYERRIVSCVQRSNKYQHIYFMFDTPLKAEKIFLVLKNILPRVSQFFLSRFNKKILSFVRGNEIDTLLIVKGAYIFAETISIIQNEHPRIRIVLYEWDSIRSNPNALNLINIINESYTFDFDDAQNDTRLKYLPLFYSFDQLPNQQSLEKDIDFLFVGAFSLERIPIILKIKELCDNNNWEFTFHLYVPYGVYVKYIKAMHPYKRFISFKSIEFNDYYYLVRRSKVVIDIASPTQTGLTIRSIEALSQNCHLLTTNKKITEMDFYTSSNVSLLDSDNINVDVLTNALESSFNSDYNTTIYSTKEWLEQMSII